ncbi:hypothetical protein SLA2020_075270 [Shorea laevis]
MALQPSLSPAPPSLDPNLPTPPLPPDLAITAQKSTPSALDPLRQTSHSLDLPVKSFKDTLVDGSSVMEPPLVTYEELVAANLDLETTTPMVKDGTNPPQSKIPKVRIPKSIWQRLCAPWKNVVIIKVLGKSVNFHLLHSRLLKEWRTESEFEIIDVGLGYYIVRPELKPPKWQYGSNCMEFLLFVIIKQFAYIWAVKSLPSSVDLDLEGLPQSLIPVEFEGLHKICFHCGEFGHSENHCHYKNLGHPPHISNPSSKAMIELTLTLKPNSDDNNMVFGP